jgi:hypothetical protein
MKRLRIMRAALKRKAPTPLGAVARGLLAGAIGAGVQSLFLLATKNLAPEPTPLPPGAAKPEPEAQGETSLQTVARRLTEDMMQRGPVSPEQKSRAGSVIHYLFGAGWGALYGLCRESFRVSPLGFGAAVWMAADNVILPAFRVAAPPQSYSLREHHYALQSHFVYGLSTAAAYALLRDLGPVPLSTVPALLALQAWAWMLRTPPARLLQRKQPWPVRFFRGTLVQKAALA